MYCNDNLHAPFDMNLYYVYLESHIFKSSLVFCLALCVVFIYSLCVCYSCYYNNFVSMFTIRYQLHQHYSYTKPLPRSRIATTLFPSR